MPERAPIIDELVTIRKAWGLSVGELADLIKCSDTHLARLEYGSVTPSFRLLIKWADAMGYDVVVKQRQ